MEKSQKIANLYVATLRAIYLIHQHSHWLVRGVGFYGHHLLFERLYQSAQKDADLAAEKFLGLFQEDFIDYQLQSELINKILNKYTNLSIFERSLKVEQDFLNFAEEAYQFFENNKIKTLGLDDMLAEISSHREEACYLLKQSEE